LFLPTFVACCLDSRTDLVLIFFFLAGVSSLSA
jgi:hypothetical protein